MKTRNGFVSNSSSSSFILKGADININEVAISALNTVIEDWGLSRDPSKKRWLGNLKKLFNDAKLSKEVAEGTLGILLPSTNYETYMFIKDGAIYISTANNHHWEFERLASFIGGGADYEDEDEVHKHINDVFYYDVRSGKIVSHERYSFNDDKNPYCPTCGMTAFGYFVVRGKEKERVCSSCRKTVIERLGSD